MSVFRKLLVLGTVFSGWGCALAVASGPVISEFLASNESSLDDRYGDSSDWVEVHNPTGETLNLDGWYLTDDANDLEKWEFPSVVLAPGGYRIVFASGRNDRDPSGELHADFALRAGGESVLLVEPDGVTVAHGYPDYPPQFVDISYGLSSDSVVSQTQTMLIPDQAEAKALIPSDGSLGADWTQVAFDDSAWMSGQTGVGYDYAGLIGLDVAAMRNVNQTVYVRIPFVVDDAASVDRLSLRMKYEDGFVAYLNGIEAARANAPDESLLTWNAGATANRPDGDAVVFEEFDLTGRRGLLLSGANVLAIHGLNQGLTSSDLLLLPELVAAEVETLDPARVTEGYLLQPTPGGANQATLAQVGPAIRHVTRDPPAPAPDEDLVITAEVTEALTPVAEVRLLVRLNFSTDTRWLPADGLLMTDDGGGADVEAGDGVFTAIIPASLYNAGHMVCWAVEARDTEGNVSRDPLFPYRDNSPEYYGTVVQDPSIDTALPIMQWFVADVAASERDSGTRGAVYFLGEFYDNVVVHRRGGSTAGAPKKHFKFRLNRGYKFRYADGVPRVNEFNLNSTYSDKAYLRQNLAFEAYDWCGCPGSESFLVHARRNDQFYGVQVFIEEPEEELIEREGLDPRGALYKMYNTFNVGGGAEKKSRQWEGRQDLDDFCRAINNTSGQTLHNNIFDLVNLPLALNYLAATILCHQNDHPHKNHYLYRDSEGSGEWCFLPWDHDLTWGSNWIGDQGGSYGDVIYADDDQVPGRSTSVKPSHPFVGKADCREWNNHWNHLIDALLEDAVVCEMYLRRLRTVMDEFLQPPGTPYAELFVEDRIDELVASMAGDVAVDYRMWADPWTWGGQEGYPRDQSFGYAINVLKEDYLAVRRTHLYVTHGVDFVQSYHIAGSYSAAIPNAQPPDPDIEFGAFEYNPVTGIQDEEYIELVNPNAFAVDISGWRLTGGVEHTFLPGTVIVAGGSLYVSPNVRAFRSRPVSPRGGEGRFVQGNYKGHLSSWGETVNLLDPRSRRVDALTYVGEPSDQQRYLRVTEIMYNPADGGAFDNDEYEFIELKNVGPAAVSLDGVKLTEGVAYAFEAGRQPTLAGGACIVVVKNRTAFTERYGAAAVILAPGTYTGRLSNGGETIKLEDRTNGTILEFTYDDAWFQTTDGQGHSLAIKNPAHPDRDSWDDRAAWQASAEVGGSPGLARF